MEPSCAAKVLGREYTWRLRQLVYWQLQDAQKPNMPVYRHGHIIFSQRWHNYCDPPRIYCMGSHKYREANKMYSTFRLQIERWCR